MSESVEFFIACEIDPDRADYRIVCNTGGQHLYVSRNPCTSLADASGRIEVLCKSPQYKNLKFLDNWTTYTAGELGNLKDLLFYDSWATKPMYIIVDRHSSKVYNFNYHTNVASEPPADADRSDASLADKYPKYYKRIPEDWKVIDVYGVHHLFPIKNDDSGCIRHSSKKLLLPGVRTGGKSFYKEIVEARDTLNRWLELNKELLNE